MLMKAISQPKTDLTRFLEIVLMWHKSGDVPMDRAAISVFIEDEEGFPIFLESVNFWCNKFGLCRPTRKDVVITLYGVHGNPTMI